MADKLDLFKIQERINEKIKCYVLESVDSTNTYCKRIIDNEENPVFIVVSEEQTNGRGRLGRSFYSPKHNGLYLSFAFRLKKLNDSVPSITTLTACIVTNAIEALSKKELKIKWVNDIYYKDKKVCGILTESKTKNNDSYIIIGVGINVFEESFPEELKDIAISLDDYKLSRNELVIRISNDLLKYLSDDYYLQDSVNKEYIEFYRKHSNIIGKNIIYYNNGEKEEATALDVNNQGELIVKSKDEKLKILRSGEITVRMVK